MLAAWIRMVWVEMEEETLGIEFFTLTKSVLLGQAGQVKTLHLILPGQLTMKNSEKYQNMHKTKVQSPKYKKKES